MQHLPRAPPGSEKWLERGARLAHRARPTHALTVHTTRTAGFIALFALGCGGSGPLAGPLESSAAPLSAEQLDAARLDEDVPNTAPDATGGALRLIEIPTVGGLPSVVHTPAGYFAVSSRSLGQGKVLLGLESALYRSRDGVRWQRVPLLGSEDVALTDIAYGGGRYVMVGWRFGGEGVVWTSGDGERWGALAQPVEDVFVWRRVAFAGERFFAMGFNRLGVSVAGDSWRVVPIDNVQPQAVAHGDGRYLLVGSGPPLLSSDGLAWQAHPLDCALPGACISPPDGSVGQGSHWSALFAESRFFTEELSSDDGVSWQPRPGRSPQAHEHGRFLGQLSLSGGLETWVGEGGPIERLHVVRPAQAAETAVGRDLRSVGALDASAPLPDSVEAGFEDGLTCVTARCLLLDDLLLLVPPPGTPPLPDRVPRAADGAPLLSDDCPVSSQLACDDYAARAGCACTPDAPRAPESCEDVSHFVCAGAFEPREGEWPLSEVGPAGCSCDGVDAAQPPTLGSHCEAGDGRCAAPLECLPVLVDSVGGPAPERRVCTSACASDADCPAWEATGFCAGPVRLRCEGGVCQPRRCD